MVARELGTNRLLRLWQDELAAGPPFPINDDVLFVAYFASAEIGCFLELGWPVPARILDLFAEFRNATNGMPLPAGRSLLGALSHYGISSITSDQKTEERGLVMRGGPWTAAERERILSYCATDVDVLGPLLERMLPGIHGPPQRLGQALLRGRYMAAVARMERTGVPIDTEMLRRLRANWGDIKTRSDRGDRQGLRRVRRDDVQVRTVRRLPGRQRDRLAADRDGPAAARPRHCSATWRSATRRLEPLKELRHALSELRLEKLAVGSDERNRTLLSPFGASSGRNTPSNNRFIFGPSVWLRGLIKPPEGRALAYVDWKSQEVYIAAKLSGDPALLDAVLSGDPYLAFAKMAGLAPQDATKQTHKAIRDLCKTCVLGTNYGMQAISLAARTGLSVIEAQDLLRRLAQTFPTFTAWAEQVVNVGQLAGYLSTVFGWTVRTENIARSTTLRNFPMQANGAEMLRLACCLATERGVDVCAPVHDALLIEGDADGIDDAVAATQAAMTEASRIVLDGLVVDTHVEVIRWPERYSDDRGRVMWERVTEILSRCEGQQGQQGQQGQGG